MNNRVLYNFDKAVISFLFLLSILAPFVVGFVEDDRIVSSIEKRKLAKLPLWPDSLAAISEYPDRLSTYYADHFGYRDLLSELYSNMLRKLGSETSFDDVTVGKRGWYFLGSIKPGYNKYDDPMGDAVNMNVFTEVELNKFVRSIVSTKNWLGDKGIEYVFVIAPNKHTIYFENLPNYILKQNEKSSTDQVVEYLRVHTDVAVLDLREPLLEAKNKHQLYYKTDTHWNHYGANVAQFELMKKIQSIFPKRIKPFLLDENLFEIHSTGGGDLASFAKLQGIKEDRPKPIFQTDCMPEDEQSEMVSGTAYTTVCETADLNALIFRDSFFTALQPYVSRQFKRSTYVWSKLNYALLSQYVDKEDPDIVIDEVVERKFPYVRSNDFFDIDD